MSLSVQIKPQTHSKTVTPMLWQEDVYLDALRSVMHTKTSLITLVKISALKASLPLKYCRHVWQYAPIQHSLGTILINVLLVAQKILGVIQRPKPAWMDATMVDSSLIIPPTCVWVNALQTLIFMENFQVKAVYWAVRQDFMLIQLTDFASQFALHLTSPILPVYCVFFHALCTNFCTRMTLTLQTEPAFQVAKHTMV